MKSKTLSTGVIVLAIVTGSVSAGTCPGEGPCCEKNGTPGCEDSACCIAVCEINPSCCVNPWVGACVNIADFITTIPGVAFSNGDDEEFGFKGALGADANIEIEIEDGAFKVEVQGLDANGFDFDNPVPFSFRIGNDIGETEILFERED